jgi:hypothetical protein
MLHNLHQLIEIGDDIAFHLFELNQLDEPVKELSGTIDFSVLNQAELHGGHCTFSFSNKIDMLYVTFLERNSPVGVVSTEYNDHQISLTLKSS